MLLLKTWRDLLARKAQFAGLLLVVALGVSTFVAFQTSYLDLKASVEKANAELEFADFSTAVMSAPMSELDAIRRLRGVYAAEGRLVQDVSLDLTEGAKAKARIVGIPDERRPRVNDLLLESGRWPVAGDDEALLHVKFAQETGARPGDRLTLRMGRERREVRVVGIVASPEYMYAVPEKGSMPSPREFAVLFMREHDAGQLLGKPGAMTDVSVVVDPGANVGRVIDRVEHQLEPYHVVQSTRQADQASSFMLGEEIEQNRVMALFLPAVILAISSSSLLIALSRLVTSQRGEIGLAKALGYTDAQVLGHYLLFSVVIAVLGSLLGFALGDLIARGVAGQYVSMLGVPFLEHHVYPEVVAGAVGVSALACLAAGIAPAWRSSRIPPARAMHADPSAALGDGRVPLLERALSPVLPRSFTFRIPFRNVFRQKRRSFYTIVGISFALVLTVATQSMFDAVDVLLTRLRDVTERWDVQAVYDEPFGADRLAEVRRWNGVRRVQGALVVPAEIRSDRTTQQGAITCMEPSADFHGFEIAQGEQPRQALKGGGIILGNAAADKLGVSVGDTVSVKTPYREERTRLGVAAIANETLGAPVFASLATAKDLTGSGETRYNEMYVDAEPRQARQIKERLNDLKGAVSVVVKSEMIGRFMEMMEFTNFYQGLLLAFGFSMGFVVIYNTLTANVLERTREIATMRTIGESSGRLAVMVTIENLLLGIAAVPLGIWLGMRTADALYAQLSSEAFTLTAVIKPESVAVIVGSVLLVMLVSEVPPIRRIFRLDLAEATKVLE